MSVIIGVRVAKKRKITSTKTSTSTSSSSTSSKPNTTQNTTQTTANNCNCESRLSALEQKINNINSCTCDKSKITSLETAIANLQTQFNSLSDNQNVIDSNTETIRLYPSAYPYTLINRSELNTDASRAYQICISESNYTDEEIYNALKFNDTYIKDSVYAPYFTVSKKIISVSLSITDHIELDHGILPLNIYVDLPNITRINDEVLVFCFFNRNIYELGTNNIHFEIEYVATIKDKINIKITYPETVQITSNIDNKFINTLQGKEIRITNEANNDEYLSDIYTLVAQGTTKTYEIIIDWYKTNI